MLISACEKRRLDPVPYPPRAASSTARRGIRIDWHRHVHVGVPVTLATLAITAVWLALRVAHAASA